MAYRNSGKPRSAICVVIDRLSAGFIGAFGNTWVRTPQIDRLASQSLVFDRALIDSPSLLQAYRGYWCGQHAASPSGDESRPSLMTSAAQQEIPSILVTDTAEVLEFEIATEFSRTVQVQVESSATCCDAIEDTHLANFFASAMDVLSGIDSPSLLWMHTRGLAAPWDAPLDFRNDYAAEDDPVPPANVQVPSFQLAGGYDPDDLLGVIHSYAGQVTLLDACLGAFIEAVDESPLGENTLLAVVSPRGFPLGEHLVVGAEGDCPPLYSELVHVPWLIRFPGGRAAACRSSEFVQPADFFHMLTAAHGAESVAGPAKNRAVVIGDTGEYAIRTPAWYMKSVAADSPELFRKPDDRWDVSNVADLCPEIIEKLELAFKQARRGDMNAPLDELLVTGIE